MPRMRLALCGFLGLLGTGIVEGQEWVRFRGPNGQGISQARSIPITWTEKDFNWKAELPGGGHSSPVVWGEQVFVTCERSQPVGGSLLSLDAQTGQVRWERHNDLTAYSPHADNSYAAATPAVDADAVYVLWQTAQETILAAVDHQGHEIWRRDLPGIHSRFGPGTSPMLVGKMVVFTREQEGEEEYHSEWMAVDRKTGQTRWTLSRKNSENSCSTPCLYQPKDTKAQLIFTSETDGLTGVDPETGSVLWESGPILPGRVVGSPVLAEDVVISACGKGGTGNLLVAARIPPQGAGRRPEILYALKGRLIPYVPTPLARDGLLYVFHDQGEIRCLRVRTGEVLWSQKPAGRFYGSPVWVNGLLYGVDRQGKVVVLRAGPAYKLLAVNALGEKSHATPTVANETMYLRTYSHLISLGGKRN